MNLDDIFPAPNSKKLADMVNKVFGYTVDLNNLNKSKANRLRESFSAKLANLEKKLGAKTANNRVYLENKLFLETIDRYISEQGNEDHVRELVIYAQNNPDLYRQHIVPVQRNLTKKYDKGVYDHNKAVKLWKYVADDAAMRYAKEYGSPDIKWSNMFSVADRIEAAKHMADNWQSELDAGNKMEAAKNPYAIGMAAAMKSTGDEPPLAKSTIKKAHKIAKQIEKNEGVTESILREEGEMQAAEITMAAKSMVDKIQGMLEDLGEMINEELPPLTDAVRDQLGSDVSANFSSAMSSAVTSALESMRSAREGADSATRILTGEQPAPSMGAEAPAEEPAMEPTTGMDTEAEAGTEDFGAADAAQAGQEPLGRAKRV